MKDNKRNIDELFRDELGNYTEIPPSSVWDTLENRLDQHNGANRRIISWWFYMLVILLFIGGSIAAYFAGNKHAVPSSIPVISNQGSGQNNNDIQQNIQTTQEANQTSNDKNSLKAGYSGHESSSEQYHAPNERTSSENAGSSKLHSNENKRLPGNSGNKKNSGKTGIHTGTATTGQATGRRQKSGKQPPSGKDSDRMSPEPAANPDSKGLSGTNESGVMGNTGKKTTGKKNKKEGHSASGNATGSIAIRGRQSSAGNQLLSEEHPAGPASGKPDEKSPETVRKGKDTRAFLPGSNSKPAANQVTNNNIKDNPSPSFNKKARQSPEAIQKTGAKTAERGLSGIPEDFYDEDDIKEEPSKMTEAYNFEPAPKTTEVAKPKNSLLKKMEEARALNPLAGAPLAANDTDENPGDHEKDSISDQSAGAGGGGGGGTSPTKDKTKRALGMTIGIKAGFERGAENYTASKYTAALFGEISLGKKFSLIIQPGIKMGQTNRQSSSSTNSYIDANPTTTSLVSKDSVVGGPGYTYGFKYNQFYDSIVASIVTERKFIEIEVPFIYKYQIDQNFSIMGGLNFTFGKVVGPKLSMNRIKDLSMSELIYQRDSVAAPAPGKFSHPGSLPFSSFNQENTNVPSPIRFGYTMGFSYTFRQRLLLDVMIQQNLSGLSNIKDEDVRRIFAQPYVRLSLGCIIFGSKK